MKAAAKNRNANALRRRLDIADGGGDTLAENPMLYHGRGAAVAGEAAAGETAAGALLAVLGARVVAGAVALAADPL